MPSYIFRISSVFIKKVLQGFDDFCRKIIKLYCCHVGKFPMEQFPWITLLNVHSLFLLHEEQAGVSGIN
jgi:hypothetical protein